MTADPACWQQRLEELAIRHQVPGASLAILADDAITTAVTGVLNIETGVQTTADSVFQIGSITKVWITTLLMQLVEEGRLDLDATLDSVLPELSLATPGATALITVRHLLSHCSGIDGDMFDDFGRGADNVARYVAGCGRLQLIHPPGATMSYCNAGFVIAGRIIETLTGGTWDRALRRRLIKPLGLRHTVTLADEAIRFRAAFGHLDIDGEQQLAAVWPLSGGAGPAGGIVATATDVLAFAALHLRGGVAPDGTRLLSAASVMAMQEPQIEVPSYPAGSRQVGLGWQLYNWNGHRLYGHNGGTLGQTSFLFVLPGSNAAVCLLTNGGHPESLFQDLFTEIFSELWQVTVPARPQPAVGAQAVTADQSRYVGRFEREGNLIEVSEADAGLQVTMAETGPLAEFLPDDEQTAVPLLPVAEDVFAARWNERDPWQLFVFYQLDGQGSYVHEGGRSTPWRAPPDQPART
jgi:CubicO group peptidase (beta-lactamase class C family)